MSRSGIPLLPTTTMVAGGPGCHVRDLMDFRCPLLTVIITLRCDNWKSSGHLVQQVSEAGNLPKWVVFVSCGNPEKLVNRKVMVCHTNCLEREASTASLYHIFLLTACGRPKTTLSEPYTGPWLLHTPGPSA